MGILVIGSFMMDLVVQTPRAPQNGETIIGNKFSRFPGGKGANQAVAASRLGGDVTMVGKVGDDEFGDEFISLLKNEKINTDQILRDNHNATGIGIVTIEENGDNRIIVVPGANLNYQITELQKVVELIKEADVLVVQLEMDVNLVEQAISIAFENQVPVILNPAPAQVLSDELLSKVTYLTPNETEAEILTSIKIQTRDDAELAARVLIGKGVKHVILTLAEDGALIVNKSGSEYVSGFPVKAIDSVAAGDSFNGALAVGVTRKLPLKEVIRFANAVGALTVTKEGAIPSLPNEKEVETFMLHLNKH